jgi:hypothetical protein
VGCAPDYVSILINVLDICVNRFNPWLLHEALDLELELARMPTVILVDESDHITAGLPNGLHSCSGCTTILIKLNERNRRRRVLVRLLNVDHSVAWRSIINNCEVPMRIGLTQDAVYGLSGPISSAPIDR